MNNWVEVVRNFPGLPSNEVFSHLKRSILPVFRERNTEVCKCVNLHTNYPNENAVIFAIVVEAASEPEAKMIAEQYCDSVLGRVTAPFELV
jgi:hypothetical protein